MEYSVEDDPKPWKFQGLVWAAEERVMGDRGHPHLVEREWVESGVAPFRWHKVSTRYGIRRSGKYKIPDHGKYEVQSTEYSILNIYIDLQATSRCNVHLPP
jgi:hypothetical protein